MSTETLKYPLHMLFSQLTWPSGLVKERACVAISDLLMDSNTSDSVLDGLMQWLSRQNLESFAAYALLPLVRSKDLGVPLKKTGRQIWSAISSRSILTWLLIQEIDSQEDIPFEESLVCSEAAPSEFAAPEFFDKYVKIYLPPIYDYYAENIPQMGIPFRKQWAFEWQNLNNIAQAKLSDRPILYWQGSTSDRERCMVVDTRMSEVYRSAFLRALAKLVLDRSLPKDLALFLAAGTCPLDLDLWKITPTRKPEWWPVIESSSAEIDLSAAEIWKQVELLWEKRQKTADQKCLIKARGIVYDGDTVYELAILGLFQRRHSPEQPDLEKIANWYLQDEKNQLILDHRSILRFGGYYYPQPINDFVESFDGWTVLAASNYSRVPAAVPRWQMWRVERDLSLPNPCLLDEPAKIICEKDHLAIRNTNGELGQWHDWTDGLTERRIDVLPAQSGNYLKVERENIERFAERTSSNFCWLCCLTRYYREHQTYGDFKKYKEFRIFGAANIAKP